MFVKETGDDEVDLYMFPLFGGLIFSRIEKLISR